MEELAVNSIIFYSVLAFYELISYLKSFNPFGRADALKIIFL